MFHESHLPKNFKCKTDVNENFISRLKIKVKTINKIIANLNDTFKKLRAKQRLKVKLLKIEDILSASQFNNSKEHIYELNNKFRCLHCNFSSKDTCQTQYHFIKIHCKTLLYCKKCNSEFTTVTKLQHHFFHSHNDNVIILSENSYLNDHHHIIETTEETTTPQRFWSIPYLDRNKQQVQMQLGFTKNYVLSHIKDRVKQSLRRLRYFVKLKKSLLHKNNKINPIKHFKRNNNITDDNSEPYRHHHHEQQHHYHLHY